MTKPARHPNPLLSTYPSVVDGLLGELLWPGHNAKETASVSSERGEDGTISIFVEVPGFAKEDLNIQFNEETSLLTIASTQEEKSEGSYQRKSFNYQYTLRGYNPETLQAVCEKGVLTIKASPYPKKRNVRTIEVK